jgi:hypothetical protein
MRLDSKPVLFETTSLRREIAGCSYEQRNFCALQLRCVVVKQLLVVTGGETE